LLAARLDMTVPWLSITEGRYPNYTPGTAASLLQ
jgi:hypothetical protein